MAELVGPGATPPTLTVHHQLQVLGGSLSSDAEFTGLVQVQVSPQGRNVLPPQRPVVGAVRGYQILRGAARFCHRRCAHGRFLLLPLCAHAEQSQHATRDALATEYTTRIVAKQSTSPSCT